MKLAINGFGRIGRAAFKIALEKKDIEIVGINDLTDAKTLAHLLKYDTAYGLYDRDIKAEGNNLIVEGKSIPISAVKEPASLPWKDLAVDVVLECTGKFVKKEDLELHIKAGAKKVILSAPSKGDNPAPTYVLGVNDKEYKGENVINNASCTTNCIAPVMLILQEKFGVKKAMLDTIHAYTHDQNIQDGPHKDLRRARAAACNMTPTSTGAAIAATEAIPALKGKFDGTSIRVPVPVGSISDITVVLEKPATVEEINKAFTEAAEGKMQGILEVTSEPIVSSDIVGNPASSIVDLSMTQVVGGDLAKVFSWYDNEWGYSNRLVEMACRIFEDKPIENHPASAVSPSPASADTAKPPIPLASTKDTIHTETSPIEKEKVESPKIDIKLEDKPDEKPEIKLDEEKPEEKLDDKLAEKTEIKLDINKPEEKKPELDVDKPEVKVEEEKPESKDSVIPSIDTHTIKYEEKNESLPEEKADAGEVAVGDIRHEPHTFTTNPSPISAPQKEENNTSTSFKIEVKSGSAEPKEPEGDKKSADEAETPAVHVQSPLSSNQPASASPFPKINIDV